MYLNLTLTHNKGYNLHEIITMQILKQNRTEDNEDYLAMYFTDEMIERFQTEGIIKSVKKKRKSDSDFKVMRLTKKGEKILELAQTPELEDDGDEQMFEYLCQMYLNHEDEDRVIGNKKKTRKYCTIFRNRLSLSLHEMYWLCMTFLQEYKFTKKLENIFFDSNKNRYGTFESNFEDSALYQYFDENKEKIEKVWATRIKPEDQKN